MTTNSPNLTATAILEIIEQAKNAELCRDMELSRRVLKEVWDDPDLDPQFPDSIKAVLQAELFRLCGFYLSYYGRAKSLATYQERGKNLLTRAIKIFTVKNLPHKASETKVILALCYWYEGAINESEDILTELEREYSDNHLHTVYLQICINRLILLYRKEKYKEALILIDKLKPAMDLCDDFRLQTMYHNQAGIICRQLLHLNENFIKKTFAHFEKAIYFSKKANNRRFEAQNLNNLGNMCKDVGRFSDAHYHIDKALQIFDQLGEDGWQAHVLDTKATIFIAENSLVEALETIDRAIEIFRRGEDHLGLTDALFNRVRIYHALGDTYQASVDFAELMSISLQRVSEFAARNYAEKFSMLFYPLKNTDFHDEVRSFKKTLLTAALSGNNNKLAHAAKQLGISHQSFSEMLNTQFPEIYGETGLQRRTRTKKEPRRTNVEKSSRIVSIEKVYIEKVTPKIQILAINHADIVLPENLEAAPGTQLFSFVMSGRHLPELNTGKDVIVLTSSVEETTETVVIAQHKKTREFVCIRIGYDDFSRLFYLKESFDGISEEPRMLDDFNIYGKIVGYHLLSDDQTDRLVFAHFPETI